jgi:hypothetical protein
MYFLKYSRDKEEENGQAFLGINILSPLIKPHPLPPNSNVRLKILQHALG